MTQRTRDAEKSLGERVRELRLKRGLSQRALAARVGVSFPHISKIESGVEPASADLIVRLAAELGVDESEMLLLADRMPPEIEKAVLEKRDLAVQFLRKWRDGSITDDQVERLVQGESVDESS